jgi:hypothetical protein
MSVHAPFIPAFERRNAVQNEARDEKGHWTRVGRLVHNLKGITPLSLHGVIPRYHWFKGSSGLQERDPNHTGRISFQNVPWYKKFMHPLDPMGQNPPGSDHAMNHIHDQLDAMDRDTLHKLTYGDIPTSWGHDPAYLDHLRQWSGQNKLVDEDGLPYRVFHGTGAVFNQFEPNTWGSSTKRDDAKKGFFFTSSPEDAGFFAFYGLTVDKRKDETPSIYPVHLRLNNPLCVVDRRATLDMKLSNAALDFAHKHGYDGVVIYKKELPPQVKGSGKSVGAVINSDNETIDLYGNMLRVPRESGMVVATFRPDSIKSAIGNTGQFNASNLDITKSHDPALVLLEKGEPDKSIKKRVSKPKHKPGDTVHYTHPNYPNQKRQGKVLASGKDGYLVLHSPSGHEERVRHEHIVSQADKKDNSKDSVVAKSMNGAPMGQKKKVAGKPDQPEWTPSVQRLPYQVGHAVMYQRPDMVEPSVGRVDSIGRHGAVVSKGDGARHKVRWEHVQSRVDGGIRPEERQDTAAVLREMGLPIDPLEELLTGDRKPKTDKKTQGRIEALAAAGAPIDTKRAAVANADSVQRLLAHLTGNK